MSEDKKTTKISITDVEHPNKSAPSGNSKSVIVGHGPILKDPMMKDGEQVPTAPLLKPSTKTPLPKAEPKPDSEPVSEPEVVEAPQPEPAPTLKPETETSDIAPPSDDSADEPTEKLVEDEQQKQAAHIQKLIDGKKYYLPINSLEKRRTKRFVLLGLLLGLLLLLVWLNVALDSGIISLPANIPHTHYFNS